jgi:chaperonin GroES
VKGCLGRHPDEAARSQRTLRYNPVGKENPTMTVRPLHDRLLIKRIEEKETVKGGIIIPDTAKEKPQEGEVIAVGRGKKTEEGKVIPLDVKAGDRILFGKYSGSEIKLDEQEYLILREDEVLGVVEGARHAAGKK